MSIKVKLADSETPLSVIDFCIGTLYSYFRKTARILMALLQAQAEDPVNPSKAPVWFTEFFRTELRRIIISDIIY